MQEHATRICKDYSGTIRVEMAIGELYAAKKKIAKFRGRFLEEKTSNAICHKLMRWLQRARPDSEVAAICANLG